jgi:hypothetical protein
MIDHGAFHRRQRRLAAGQLGPRLFTDTFSIARHAPPA